MRISVEGFYRRDLTRFNILIFFLLCFCANISKVNLADSKLNEVETLHIWVHIAIFS